MLTAEEVLHPVYTMKDSIGAKLIYFGKVKYFTYKREAEGVKELLAINWNFIKEDPRKYKVPPILSSRVKNYQKETVMVWRMLTSLKTIQYNVNGILIVCRDEKCLYDSLN